MNDRTKLMGSTTIHTPDHYFHDWHREEAERREDAIDEYITEQLEELRAKIVAFHAPEIFEQVIENMDTEKTAKITRWLFQIWQCRNTYGMTESSKYAVSIIADLLHDELINELEKEAKAIID